MRTHLGEQTDIQVVNALLQVQGLQLLDLGCGPAKATELLVEHGGILHGIEPDPVQAQRNRERAPIPGLTLSQGRAEALTQADDSVDGVFFFRSLHHVPINEMDTALAQAKRVVRTGGFVFVLEPSIHGAHTSLMRPFHDETLVRGAAQKALNRAEQELFDSRTQFECLQHSSYESFQAMVERFCAMSFNAIRAEQVDQPSVRQAFEAGRLAQAFVFDQPILIDLFRVA